MDQPAQQPRLRPQTPVATVKPAHRRIGLVSLALLLLGAGWIGGNVLPGIQQTGAQTGATQQASASGLERILNFVRGVGNNAEASPKPGGASVPRAATPAEFANTEVGFVDAPIGLALQMMLVTGQYSASADADVVGTVTYSNIGDKKPLMVAIGRVIGASTSEHGVQILHRWDSFEVARRDVTPIMSQYGPMRYSRTGGPTSSPTPVPWGESTASHRLAGVITVQPTPSLPTGRIALLETRIPGEVPQWHVVREGDPLLRRTERSAEEMQDPTANIDLAPTVESIQPNKIVLRGGGDKRLEIPLSRQGVADTFGFAPASKAVPSTGFSNPVVPMGSAPGPAQSPRDDMLNSDEMPGRGAFTPPISQRGSIHP